MVDDQDKEIYYPMSFLEQMTWVQEDIEHILNNNTLETMRSAGVERFGEPGYGGSIKRLLEIIKTDPKNKPLLREINKAEKELLLFIYDEHTDLTEEYIRNYWKEFFEAYCHALEQNNGRESNANETEYGKGPFFLLITADEWNHDDDRWLGIYVSKKDAREAYDRAVVWWAEEQRQMSFSTSQRVALFEYVAFDDRFREVDRKELD